MTGVMVESAAVTPRDCDPKQGTLIERFCAGDSLAIGEIYDRFHVSVYATAYRAGLRDCDCPDLTHDVFVKVIEARAQFRGTSIGQLANFIKRTTVNALIDRRRRAGRRRTLSLEELAEPALPQQAPLDLETLLVQTFVANLSDELRTLYEHVYVQDSSGRELSRTSDKKRHKVRESLEELHRRAAEFFGAKRGPR